MSVFVLKIIAMITMLIDHITATFVTRGTVLYMAGRLIGRIAFPYVEEKNLDYIKAADKALKDIPHICEMDIGHTDPAMTLINGAAVSVTCADGAGKISFKLK